VVGAEQKTLQDILSAVEVLGALLRLLSVAVCLKNLQGWTAQLLLLQT